MALAVRNVQMKLVAVPRRDELYIYTKYPITNNMDVAVTCAFGHTTFAVATRQGSCSAAVLTGNWAIPPDAVMSSSYRGGNAIAVIVYGQVHAAAFLAHVTRGGVSGCSVCPHTFNATFSAQNGFKPCPWDAAAPYRIRIEFRQEEARSLGY